MYQIEVYAYTDTIYRLTMDSGASASSRKPQEVSTSKTAPTQPIVAASDEPPGDVAIPAVVASINAVDPATSTPTPGGRIYIPIAPLRPEPGGW